MSEMPRRNQMNLWSVAEKAIFDAMQAVEHMPADVRLTEAVVLLGKAQSRVADFIDGNWESRGTPESESK